MAERPRHRLARFLSAGSPVLVLGSHQDAGRFDAAALEEAGLTLARRASAGSAVLVGPGLVLWLDLLLPAGDPLWDDDVGRAAWWVGRLWADAMEAAGVGRAEVWTGPMRRSPWSGTVCFAGLGPGEVTMGGAKVVGVSQRRSVRGALFQTAALIDWDPGLYSRLVVDAPEGPLPPAVGIGAAAALRLESALRSLLMP